MHDHPTPASKVARLPMWRFRLLDAEQRKAYDQLRWHRPGPAERARLKGVLGWRRTREETLALAHELLDDGRMIATVSDDLGVSRRYLRRLLAEESRTSENGGSNPSIHAPEMALTRNPDTCVPPGGGDRA
jgi:hypothetical protein